MNLDFNIRLAKDYSSKSQIARVLTEDWVKHNAYCPNCFSPLKEFENNRPVADFFCGGCCEQYELKSKKGNLGKTVNDGDFKKMIERISASDNPNFFFLNYQTDWRVNNFLIIPKHFFNPDMIIKRKPLPPTARRAGWIGCNIDLSRVPNAGKVYLVKNANVLDKKSVQDKFTKTLFLRKSSKEAKGWLLDIMSYLDEIPTTDFTLDTVYAFEDKLKQKYPDNNHIKDKIRQQLQILRDKNIIEFKERGNYRKLVYGNI